MSEGASFGQAVQQGTSGQPPGQTQTQCPAANPCQGLGLDNQQNAKEFTADMKSLQQKWPQLTPPDRETALKDAINKQAGKSGVPTLGLTPKALAAGNGGNFDFTTWSMNINQDLMKGSSLSDAEAKSLSNTVYHETRHAEQWYMMAQKKAADGMSAADIQSSMNIPGGTAKSAVAHPLDKKSCAYACADKIDQNVYGKDAASRSTKLKTLMSDLGTYNSALQARGAAYANPAATPASKAAADQVLQNALKAFSTSHQAYSSMPEEADAFAAGRLVDSVW